MSNQHGTLDALCRIPHLLTPREKVQKAVRTASRGQWTDGVRVGSAKWCNGLTDAILTALASGSGDHAELARLAEAARRVRRDSQGNLDGTDAYRRWEAFTVAANPATVLALLAEIAALRAEHVHLVEQKEGAEDALFNALSRATEAERKLAEAEQVIRDIAETPYTGADWPRSRAATYLASKETERG